MKKVLILLLLVSTTIFAEWKKIEVTDDFGESTGRFFLENKLEGQESIRALYFLNNIFAINCFDGKFAWNFNNDIKVSIKRESGKVASFYSDSISDEIVAFDSQKAQQIAKIFLEEKTVAIALITKDEKFIFNLDTTNFESIYKEFKNQK